MVVKDFLFLFSILTILLSSCSITRNQKKCVLIPEKNLISGFETGQKEFQVQKKYLPVIIEELINKSKNHEINHIDFWDNAKEKWVGYHIYGCKDTTWAKRTMAFHLIQKYNIERFDSIYQDTVFRLSVLDEEKLIESPDSCHSKMVIRNFIDGEEFNQYWCIPWAALVQFALPHDYNSNTNSIESDMREGNYDFDIPIAIANRYGLDYYSKQYLEPYGLSLNFERVDTISLSVYRYKYNK